MFAGHYSAALAAKAAVPTAPLWTLLLAAQAVDVLWAVFLLAGVEHASLDPSLPSNPLDLHHMPWTHSLAGTAVWSGLALVAARHVLSLAAAPAAAVAAVVASHWFLDLLVHRPDLTLAGSPPKLGLALWNYPLAAFSLEIVLVAGTVALARQRCARDDDERRRWLWLGGALLALQTATSFGPLPSSIPAMAASVLVVFFAVAFAGARVEGTRA